MSQQSGPVKPREMDNSLASPVSQWLREGPILAWRMGLGPLLGQLFMVLSTTGHVSQTTERVGLPYFVWRTRKYVVSRPEEREDWLADIDADERVTIQTAAGTETMVARRVTEDIELVDAYAMAEQSPDLRRWFEKTLSQPLTQHAFMQNKDRFVLITFDPTGDPTPEPLAVDLWWVWALVGGALAMWRLTQGRDSD